MRSAAAQALPPGDQQRSVRQREAQIVHLVEITDRSQTSCAVSRPLVASDMVAPPAWASEELRPTPRAAPKRINLSARRRMMDTRTVKCPLVAAAIVFMASPATPGGADRPPSLVSDRGIHVQPGLERTLEALRRSIARCYRRAQQRAARDKPRLRTIILRDGAPGEPEQTLGGFGNAYTQHAAERAGRRSCRKQRARGRS